MRCIRKALNILMISNTVSCSCGYFWQQLTFETLMHHAVLHPSRTHSMLQTKITIVCFQRSFSWQWLSCRTESIIRENCCSLVLWCAKMCKARKFSQELLSLFQPAKAREQHRIQKTSVWKSGSIKLSMKITKNSTNLDLLHELGSSVN